MNSFRLCSLLVMKTFTLVCKLLWWQPTISSSYSHSPLTLAPGKGHLCDSGSPGIKASSLIHRNSKARGQVASNSNLCFDELSAWNGAEKCIFLTNIVILGANDISFVNICFWHDTLFKKKKSLYIWSTQITLAIRNSRMTWFLPKVPKSSTWLRINSLFRK